MIKDLQDDGASNSSPGGTRETEDCAAFICGTRIAYFRGEQIQDRISGRPVWTVRTAMESAFR